MKNRTPAEAGSSNAVRLSAKEWVAALLIVAAASYALPHLWETREVFSPGPDFRVPDRLSEDYWVFRRYSSITSDQGKTLVLGDSVVWGGYVPNRQTLTHYLNQRAGGYRFANLGVNGAHPLALAGLIEYYGGAVKNRDVILHLNLSWLSSREADLQADKETRFNHPRLVPQFAPWIRCYTEPVSGRLGVVVERSLPAFSWARHLSSVYFDNLGLQEWSMQNPYAGVFRRAALDPTRIEDDPHPNAQPWAAGGRKGRAIPWVDADTSRQWSAFRRLTALLRARGNRLLVVIGALNEHMMDGDSLVKYRRIRERARVWLEENAVPFHTATLLPSDLYADLSHPLDKGYELLAREIAERGAPRAGMPMSAPD
mgnify:CR=1 FL=1